MSIRFKTQNSQNNHKQESCLFLNTPKQPSFVRHYSFDLQNYESEITKLGVRSQYEEVESNTTQNREQIISQYSNILEITREQLKKVQQQKNKLLIVSQSERALKIQMQQEKQYLLRQMRRLGDSNNMLQTQKIQLVTKLSEVNRNVSNLKGSLNIEQQKVYNLTRQTNKLIDELNFERQILTSIKKQNLELKGCLKNLHTSFESLMAGIQSHKKIEIFRQNLDKTINDLAKQVVELRSDINILQKKQKHNIEIQSQMKLTIIQLQSQIQEKSIQIDNLNERNNQIVKPLTINTENSNHLIKIIQVQQAKIKNLQLQISTKGLNETQNKQNNMIFEALSHKKHVTNSNYLTKIVRQNYNETQQYRKIIENKDDEIERLRDSLDNVLNEINIKSEEISMLNIHLKNQKQKNDLRVDNKQTSRKQTQKLHEKIQELRIQQKQYRLDIAQRDQIIMNYVHKQKHKTK